MKYTLSILLIFLTSILYSQTTIRGNVLNEKKSPLEYFDILLLSTQDSSLVKGGSFIDGEFKIGQIKRNEYILQISSLGYISKYININTNKHDSINFGTVNLNTKVLEEVQIIGKRPVISRKNGNLLVNVRNSSLSDAGSSIDVLRKSPGVMIDKDNDIIVLGKGTPVILINNKEVNSKKELNILQSYDIENIEINRNPSAEISASGHALIKITTKKITQDKLNLLLFNTMVLNRRTSNTVGFQLNSKLNRLKNFFSYSYNLKNSNRINSGYEKKVIGLESILNENNGIKDINVHSHNLFYGAKYSINPKNIIGLQLLSAFSNGKDSSFINEEIKYNNLINKRQNIKTDHTNDKFYDINLNYSSELDSISRLFFTADYVRKVILSNSYVNEKDINAPNFTSWELLNKVTYDVFTGKIDYERKLFKHWNTKTGLKYTTINTDSNNDILVQNSKVSSKTSISDLTKAAYLSAQRNFRKANLHLGIRYEYAELKTDFDKSPNISTNFTYSNLFPSILLNYSFNDKHNLSLSYSKRIKRPGFQMINPEIRYIDSLSYSKGNPNLKPTLSHNFEMGVELLKNFSIACDYSIKNDQIVQVATNDDDNPRITKFTYLNIKNVKSLSLNLSYNYSNKIFSNYSYLSINKPHIEIPFLNKNKVIKNLTWYFQFNNELIFTRYISMFIHFEYESSGYYDISHWEKSYNLSAGLQAKLLQKKLLLSITVNDILKTTSYSWKDQYLNIESVGRSDRDFRWIKFSLRFNFNRYYQKFNKESSNRSELERL